MNSKGMATQELVKEHGKVVDKTRAGIRSWCSWW